jgi:Bifunctional DNA primase/polymerase, N-terminal
MRQTIHLTHRTPSTVSPRLQDAVWSYAHNGWRILPLHHLTFNGTCSCHHPQCTRPGQHPCYVQDVAEASLDPTRIATWWEQDPLINIGLATGDGLLVIELDRRRIPSVDHFRQQYAVPETALVRTEYGNWQLYFTYNRALSLHTTSDKIGPGILTYGEGDYVVAPPSLLPSGPYYWQNSIPPVRLPAVLLPFVLSTRLAERAWSKTAQRPSQAALGLAHILAARPLLWQNGTCDE